MTSTSLRVFGVPQPQGSKTAYVRGGRAVITEGRNATSRSNFVAWRQAVATAARDWLEANPWHGPYDDPCAVHIQFVLPKPKSAPKKRRYPDRKPDLDKLTRAALDALVDGGLLADDARVVELSLVKVYAPEGVPTGCKITIHHMASEATA